MRIVSLLILLALVHTPAMAQDDSGYGHRDGTGGFLFVFDRLRLGSFGGGIGGKYWLSDRWAMNASVQLRQTRTNNVEGNGTIRDYLATSAGLSTAFELHPLRARFSPYVGGGIGYTYSYYKSSHAHTLGSNEYRSDTNTGAIALSLGAELWLSRNFSLAGQYSIHFRYIKQKGNSNSTSSGSSDVATDYWTTNVSAGALILAVYF